MFGKFAHNAAVAMGSAWAFWLATVSIVLWLVLGPVFDYSDSWQLLVNTGTTVLTFLAVFLIQNTQNRDSAAIQLKLDELISASAAARNRLIDLEDCTEAEMKKLKAEFAAQREAQAEDT